MVKVTVTFLAAPWPEGTVPGHVVELVGCDAIPAWAVGKCDPAPDDAEEVSTWTRPGFVVPAELTSEPVKAPAGEPVVNPEAVTEAQAVAG
jgi:hypothetical protein